MIIKFLSHQLGQKHINQTFLYGEEFVKKTGINFVYESEDGALDLAKKALENCNKNEIQDCDVLIHVTQSEIYALPNDASFLQDFSGITKQSLCLTINQGCSGFVQALALANSLIETYHYKKILIVTADSYRKYCDKNDRSTSALFSDAASVVLVLNEKGYSVDKFINFSDGNGAKFLYKKNNESDSIYMNGLEIYNFVVKEVISNIIKKNICEKNFENNSKFYIHQASQFVLHEIYKYIPEKLCPTNLAIYGNTVSTTIPLLIKDNPFESDEIHLLGFGVGLSASYMRLVRD